MVRPNRLPSIHALAAFESAARLGGFAQAAAELCVTPSAVSHRIRQLESQLGESLFDRSPTGVRLSDAGQRYLGHVREAFDKLSQLARDDEPPPLRLRVGAPPTFARNLLIPSLPDFYRQWPDIEIEIAVEAPMQEKPERHEIDIRFGRGRFDDRTPVKLFDDVKVVLAAPCVIDAHALRQPIDLKGVELLRTPLVAWRPWFAAAGLDWPEPARGQSFTDLGILLEAAASGLGVAVCPRRIAERWIASGSLVPLFGLAVPATSTYYTLVQPDQLQRPEVAAFVDWLDATFR
jgi:LysR family glycine cleavage system transcriptional activator